MLPYHLGGPTSAEGIAAPTDRDRTSRRWVAALAITTLAAWVYLWLLPNAFVLFAALGQSTPVRVFLALGHNPRRENGRGESALRASAASGKTAVIRMLLGRGVPADDPGESGITPLIKAAEFGREESARVLVAANADVNARTGDPLAIASRRGYLGVVKLLLQEGADPNLARAPSWLPLLGAARGGYREIVGALLERGANPNIADQITGETPLIEAARSGHIAIVSQLLKYGADPERRDIEGRTALYDRPEQTASKDCRDSRRSHGAASPRRRNQAVNASRSARS